MATQRIPLMRTEISGDFDHGESKSLLQIRYDPDGTNDLPGSGANYAVGTDSYTTTRPLIIYDYKIEFCTDVISSLWQWYCDDGDDSAASNWHMNNPTFLECLKQHKMVPGQITSAETPVTVISKGTLYYKAKKYWSKKHKMFKWIRPPIILSKNRRNLFGLSAANLSNTEDNRSYYGMVTIKNWHVMH